MAHEKNPKLSKQVLSTPHPAKGWPFLAIAAGYIGAILAVTVVMSTGASPLLVGGLMSVGAIVIGLSMLTS